MLLRMISLKRVASRFKATAVSANAGQCWTDWPKLAAIVVGDVDAQLDADPAKRFAEHEGVQRAGHVVLHMRFVAAVRGDQGLVVESDSVTVRPGSQGVGDPRLPVDQGAVAIEAHRLEAVELAHLDPFLCSP